MLLKPTLACLSRRPSSSSQSRTRSPLPAPQRQQRPQRPLPSQLHLMSGVVMQRTVSRGGVRSRENSSSPEGSLGDMEQGEPAASSSSGGELARVLPFVLVASLGSLLFGYHLGVINPALKPLSAELGMTSPALQGAAVSLLLAGACVGSFLGGSLADSLGRCAALRLASIPLCLGALACGMASSPTLLFAGRLVTGAGLGVSSSIVPLYISEISPIAHRGLLGCANQVSICSGILLALLVGLPLTNDPGFWRAMFLLGALPAALLFVLARSLPETPAWLARQGREAEAAAVATRLWGATGAESKAPAGEGEAGGGGATGSWPDLWLPEYRRATLLAVGLFFAQQFSGVNAVVFFSNAVFRSAGVTSDTLASAAVGAVNVLATAAAAPSLDARGRRPLLLASFLGMGLAMTVLAAVLSLPILAPFSVPLSVLGTLAYIASFAVGAGPVPSLLVAELYPPSMRGVGQSAAMLSHWVCAIMIGQGFLPAVEAFGVSASHARGSELLLRLTRTSNRFRLRPLCLRLPRGHRRHRALRARDAGSLLPAGGGADGRAVICLHLQRLQELDTECNRIHSKHHGGALITGQSTDRPGAPSTSHRAPSPSRCAALQNLLKIRKNISR